MLLTCAHLERISDIARRVKASTNEVEIKCKNAVEMKYKSSLAAAPFGNVQPQCDGMVQDFYSFICCRILRFSKAKREKNQTGRMI